MKINTDHLKELAETMDLIAQHQLDKASQIYYCVVKSVNNNQCTIIFNNKQYTVPYYGGKPTPNKTYAIFLPHNNMNESFVIGDGKDGGGGGGGSGIAIQPDPPTDGELVWIDTDDPGTTHIIPEIDDTQESAVDTWSSQKIASEIADQINDDTISASSTWSSQKIAARMSFEDFTGSITTLNCNGTISYNPSPFKVRLSGDRKFLWVSGSRVTISSFSRTGANPGIKMNLGITRDATYVFGCGFRMDATNMRPEAVWGMISTTGELSFRTTESYSNASGNPLHLFINSCIIPLE